MNKVSIEELLKKYKTSFNGLTEEEAKERLKKYGLNEIPEKKENPIKKLLKYFLDPISIIIELSIILSYINHKYYDTIIISVLLLINVIVGFLEEYKAEKIIESLKKYLSHKARVLRDKKWKIIDSKYLVPGDIIRVRIGDIVPADAIILEGNLLLDESALTGESIPKLKKELDKIFSGSIVKKGEATCLVVATGLNTYFGKTAKLSEISKERSEYQKNIIKIGYYLMSVAIILVIIMLIVETLRKKPLVDLISYALVILVASIPAALPMVLTVTMVLGAKFLARKNAVVKRLVAIEEMSSIDILCSDKTGTLTKNKLEVGKIIPLDNFSEKDVIYYALLASREEDNDPIDLAIIKKAKEMGIEKKERIIKFIPFDPEIKRTEAYLKNYKVMKGAPQVLLKFANNNKVLEIVEKLAEEGYRALGVVVCKEECKYVGIIGLYDPPREDAKQAIEKLKKMGVLVKMITGDHKAIAKNIAKILGIGENIISINELKEENIEKYDGFAEVLPEHKFMIVDLLQKRNHRVAMTGDGVNDAPALKKANVGIAVKNATDVAKNAADIVLLENGISVIADAFEIARKIFIKMRNYVVYRISETIRILLFLEVSILLLSFYPLTEIMVLLLAILNDIPIITIAYDNVYLPEKPTSWNIRSILIISSILGTIGLVETYILFLIGLKFLTLDQIRTLLFLKLVVAGHNLFFIVRSKNHFWQKPYPSKILLLAILGTDLIATIIAYFGFIIGNGIGIWVFIVWIYVLMWMFLLDAIKNYLYKKLKII